MKTHIYLFIFIFVGQNMLFQILLLFIFYKIVFAKQTPRLIGIAPFQKPKTPPQKVIRANHLAPPQEYTWGNQRDVILPNGKVMKAKNI